MRDDVLLVLCKMLARVARRRELLLLRPKQ